jgi:hypothetical protein
MTRSSSKLRVSRKAQSFGVRTLEPLRAVLLTIDAAKRSGIAVHVCGKLHYYAEADASDGPWRRRIVRDAVTTASIRNLPLGGVLEVPWGGYSSAVLSLSGTAELWRDTWRGAGLPRERLLECTASEWRRALLGRAGMPRVQARRLEHEIASQAANRDLQQARHYVLGADAAAAICMGQAAVHSSTVADRLGLSMLGRSYTP